jgi:hypothetical protein
MTVRTRGIATTNNVGRRAAALAMFVLAACFKSPSAAAPTGPSEATDADQRSAVALFWTGASAAISKPKDQTGTFNLPVTSTGGCTASGTGSYTGTLAGANVNGAGVMNVTLTASFVKCALLDGTTVTAPAVTFTGTVAIAADARSATQVRMQAPAVTINDRFCTGGIDVTVQAATPTSPATASGTACGVIHTYTLQ